MGKVGLLLKLGLLTAGAIAVLVGFSGTTPASVPEIPPSKPSITTPPPSQPEQMPPVPTPPEPPRSDSADDGPAVTVTTKPADIAVLVNKLIALPSDYIPSNLVDPNVPFIFAEKAEKRLMQSEAAQALEQMFAGAKQDGIFLAGVSGYRSYETQKGLFNYFVRTQGEATARTYSAEPGHSEHQTGLAMDVSGSTGTCAADDCFADTPEAKWLEAHAPEYGFIIRYPQGKEAITGYAYEPWHLRYLSKSLALEVTASGLTMDEYLADAK